jgi:hypothetical protein
MFDKLVGSPAAESAMDAAATVLGCHPVAYYQQLSLRDSFSNRPAQLLIGTLQMSMWMALRDQLPVPQVFLGVRCRGNTGVDGTAGDTYG